MNTGLKSNIRKERKLEKCSDEILGYMQKDYVNVPSERLKRIRDEKPEEFKELILHYIRHIWKFNSREIEKVFKNEMQVTAGRAIKERQYNKKIEKKDEKKWYQEVKELSKKEQDILIQKWRIEYWVKLMKTLDFTKIVWELPGWLQKYIESWRISLEDIKLEMWGRLTNILFRGYDLPLQGSSRHTREASHEPPPYHFFQKRQWIPW